MKIFILLLLITSCGKKETPPGIIKPAPPKVPDIEIYTPPISNTDIIVTVSIENIVAASDYTPVTIQSSIGPASISPDLTPFFNEFLLQAAIFNRSINTTTLTITLDRNLPLEKSNPNILGYCYFSNGKPIVKINPYKWEGMTDTEKESLIFHELGHCLLKILSHDDSASGLIPNSIMATNMTNVFTYYPNRKNDYLLELFNR